MDNSAYLERAAAYDVENEGKSRTMLKKASLVSEAIRKHAGDAPISVLEIGCGTGLFTRILAERFPRATITATDAFPAMLEIAKDRLSAFRHVTLAQYDAETAGSFPERFDVVCGVDLIHHLMDPVAGLRHWRAFTRPTGALVFFESNPRNPALFLRTRNRPEEARFKYNSPANLARWAAEGGWHDVKVNYASIYFPSGPSGLWPILDVAESVMHPVFASIAGGMMLCGNADPGPL